MNTVAGELIVFCSSPADAKHALALRELHPEPPCRLVVLRAEGLALFLRSLQLPGRTEIVFIANPVQNVGALRLWNNVRVRRHLDRVKRQHFLSTEGASVYFFSPYIDWALFSYLGLLRRCNTLVRLAYHTPAENVRARTSGWQWLTLLWLCWATRTRLVYRKYAGRNVVVWPDGCDVPTEPTPEFRETVAKHRYHVASGEGSGPAVLLFPAVELLATNVPEVTKALILALQQQGARVFVKPHPRFGCPSWLEALGIEVIPAHIPSEFLDLEGFSGIVGFESLALAIAATLCPQHCVSLIDLLQYRHPSRRQSYRAYVAEKSDGRVVFSAMIDQAVELLVANPSSLPPPADALG